MTPQDEIALLQASIERLIQSYREVQQQLDTYRSANAAQHDELVRSHAELESLRQKYTALQTAHALSASSPDREKAKRQITSVINKIDQTLMILQSES